MSGNITKVVTFLLVGTATIFSQIISGSTSIQLSGPATNEQNEIGRRNARIDLKKGILSWLSDQQGITIDSSNALDNFAVEQFIDSCMRFTKEEVAFRGKIMDYTLLLPYTSAELSLQNHNLSTDTKASEAWKKLKQAQSINDLQSIYFEGIRTIAAANAHFGPPLIIPESDGKPLINEARSVVQGFFDKMKVSSSNMMIEGHSGHIVSNPPTITILLDSTPLPGTWFTGKFQSNKELFSKVSNETGSISLDDFRIPFVSNGTLMYIYLDLGRVVGSSTLIQAKHFGLRLKNSQDQTFIIKINRPIYTLDFKATSVGNITMPADFANVAHIKRFLRDSCYMEEVTTGATPNLEISINSQVSDYSYDETEEVGIKTTVNIVIKGKSYNPPISSENTMQFEKRYERSIQIPYGLYFWEASAKIREQIRKTVEQL